MASLHYMEEGRFPPLPLDVQRRYNAWRVAEKLKIRTTDYEKRLAELSRMAEEQIVRAPDQKRERTIPTLWDWCRFMRESMGVKMDEHDMRRKYYELFPKAPRGDDTPEISKA